MHRFAFGSVVSLLIVSPLFSADWFQFRGPEGDGHAESSKLPTEWSKTKNVTWRKELPGNGWSSPVVSEGKIYLTTAIPGEEKGDFSLRVISLDASTGEIVWNKEVFEEVGKASPGIHSKNSHASPTAIVDGGQVFVHFGHMGTACLKASDGSIVWTNNTLKYSPVHGSGGSPVLVDDKLVFIIDGSDKQMVVGLDRMSGKVKWQTPRKTKAQKKFSFCTPLVISVSGQKQVIAPGSDVMISVDPKDGKEIWRLNYTGYSVVPKPVYANGLVYFSTGYDAPMFYAIRPNGKGDVTDTHVVWTAKKGAPHNPSPLVIDDAVYLISDGGVLTCLDGKTGEQRWNERVGGNYSASPMYANGLIYLLAEDGTATVVKPGSSFEAVAKNKMGERALASYGVDGDALLLRTEKALYRIEQK
ncbi:MAG TPA: PQQ-binding-like beta-propeller repeat protein [Gemmata sp.]|jgi:outer membrane protein assembly factor BamB|nr:PQQ-binding-like beta-propeller repeat protein [Gemmata sp.]